jgi:molybdate transport system substrate-binding protein
MTNTTEMKVMTSNALRTVLGELAPAFERAHGHKISASYDPAQRMLKRIAAGETADLAISSAIAIDGLANQGVIAAGSRRILARYGVGIAVRAGAPKPDIGSVEAFKRALLDAKSVACTVEGASGIHFTKLIERLGIAEQVNAKARRRAGGLIGELVASGEADLAVQQIPELMAVPGIELVGPLPQALQVNSVLAAGVFAASKQPEAAQALIEFLATPDSVRVFKAKGFEPG